MGRPDGLEHGGDQLYADHVEPCGWGKRVWSLSVEGFKLENGVICGEKIPLADSVCKVLSTGRAGHPKRALMTVCILGTQRSHRVQSLPHDISKNHDIF